MIRRCLSTLRWCLSLGKKFTIVVPGATMSVVGATLVSQIGLMMAMFLPLKIIILLGSDGIPRYFPASFAAVDRDMLVAWLSVGAVVSFAGHVLAERLVARSSDIGAKKLLVSSQKMVLFENQDELAKSAYQRYARALAGGIFAILVFSLIGAVYPEMAIVLIGYVLMVVIGLRLAWGMSSRFADYLLENLSTVVSVLGNIGFLIGFAWLVIDFIMLMPPGLLAAIISLLLSRLALQRICGFVTDTAALDRQRMKLDALYFHGKALTLERPCEKRSMWPLLLPERRWEWILEVLEEFAPELTDGDDAEVTWKQLQPASVAAFLVTSAGKEQSCLIKLFDRNKRSLARHEAELLSMAMPELPAPNWLGATLIDDFPCHVLRLEYGVKDIASNRPKYLQRDLAAGLLPLEPPEVLCQRFVRSRPMLWQRLDHQWFEQLRIAANAYEHELIERLTDSLGSIATYIQQLPLGLVNPAVAPNHFMAGPSGKFIHLEWGRWSLEPVGAGWPVKPELFGALDEVLAKAALSRPPLQTVHLSAASMAALLYALESLVQRGQFAGGVELVPELIGCLDVLQADKNLELQVDS